jgi:DNA-binding NarL/FixJ family response regulator
MASNGSNGAAHHNQADGETKQRIFLADSQAIYRVGIARILAQHPDLMVAGHAANYGELLVELDAARPDILIVEDRLLPARAEALTSLLHRTPVQLIVLINESNEQDTVDYLRQGARGIITRAISPELLVSCVLKVAAGDLWLDNKGIGWVVDAYRSQSARGGAPASLNHLTAKELVIVAGVSQGLRNKDIAKRIGTTEQVIKNYLRKVYLKLGVSDRLELALLCVQKHLLDAPQRKPEALAVAAGVASENTVSME